ncbi:8404_t:CDS:2 [Gigaspora margarita]|uniref:8404_t:CDS:1 n=1 Tax=Gigaspora margarita TaxID=4874 RepID=A0ABN7URG6_GIGMA|nr:8404_t:CDS:2 [Gigaspora margarita]
MSRQAQQIQDIINNLRIEKNEFENREKNYNEKLEKILTKLQISFKKNATIEQKLDLMSNSCQVNWIQDLIAELRAENKHLKKENETLKENKKENEALKKENEELKKENDKLTDENANLLTQNQNL